MSGYGKKIFFIFCAAAAAACLAGSAGAMLSQDDKAQEEFNEFTTVDLDGNEVTEELFADKDVTMVNIWGTYCTPCINEMPELGEMARSLPENQQLIGLVADVREEDDPYFELAQQIAEKAGADYTHIIAGDSFENLLSILEGVPTTYFVDSEGNILGEPILGADPDAYRERLAQYAEEYPEDGGL